MSKENRNQDIELLDEELMAAEKPKKKKKKKKKGSGLLGRIIRRFFLLLFTVVILIVVLFPRTVFGIFTHDPNVLLVCMEYIPVSVVNLACSALRDSMNGFASGCGNYKYNFAVAILDGVVGRIGFSFLFGTALGLGYFGYWMGSALAGAMPFVIGIFYYFSGSWKKKSAIVANPSGE